MSLQATSPGVASGAGARNFGTITMPTVVEIVERYMSHEESYTGDIEQDWCDNMPRVGGPDLPAIVRLCKVRFPAYRFEALKGRGKQLPYIRVTLDIGSLYINCQGEHGGVIYETEWYTHAEYVDLMNHVTLASEIITYIQCQLRNTDA